MLLNILLIAACVLAMVSPYFIMTGIYRAERRRELVPVRVRAHGANRDRR